MNHDTTTITALRSTISRHRGRRADHRRLERELGSYRTPSERRELDAILSRHNASDIHPIERILNRTR